MAIGSAALRAFVAVLVASPPCCAAAQMRLVPSGLMPARSHVQLGLISPPLLEALWVACVFEASCASVSSGSRSNSDAGRNISQTMYGIV